jgi:hypothetical protein
MAVRENQFPYIVSALTDLPEEFQRAVQSGLPAGDSINSILMLPSQPFMKGGGVPRQALLSTAQGILHVQAGKPPVPTYLPSDALLYVHHTLALLYGHVELAGEVDGKLVQVVAEYNTEGQELLDAVFAQFLHMSYSYDTTDPDESFQKQNNIILEKLSAESFKFMNGLRLYALQPGEQLLGYVFQPRIKEQFLYFFHRPIAPISLFAPTDRSVVLIEEDKAWDTSYGWIITICPCIVGLTVESKAMQKWHKLSVLLLRNNVSMERNLILESEIALTCKALWASQNLQESETQ